MENLNKLSNLFLILFSFISFNVIAGENERINYLNGNGIVINSSLNVFDDFLYVTNQYNIESGEARVRLMYSEQLRNNYENWNLSIEFDYYLYDRSNVPIPGGTGVKTLSINFKNNSGTTSEKYIDEAVFTSKDLGLSSVPHRIFIRVKNIDFTDGNEDPIVGFVFKDVFLKAEVDIKRFFIPSDVGFSSYTASIEKKRLNGYQYELAWKFIPGAEEFDVEYYFSSDHSITKPTSFSQIRTEDITRITTNNNFITLNMAYENGTLFYRVRPVARIRSDFRQRYEGPWSSSSNDTIDVHNRQTTKNWSYTAAFAENGKVAEVLAFADGTGKIRQQVTRNNSNEQAIVTDQLYDYEGRGVIKTIPTPAYEYNSGGSITGYDGKLKFYQYFNTNTSGAVIEKSEYDNSSDCVINDFNLSNTLSNASRYFSENNPFKDEFNAFIADADKYPFIRTAYNNESGVKNISGVGKVHALNNTHEILSVTGKPLPASIDRLFGSEAAYTQYYDVSSTKDPNGQVSLTYTNNSGQVVATSIVGEAPTGMHDLNPDMTPLVSDLSVFNEWDEVLGGYKIEYCFLIPSAGTYTFDYSVSPETIDELCGFPEDDCKYQLKMSMTNSCGELIYEDGASSLAPVILHATLPIEIGGDLHHTFDVTISAGNEGQYCFTKLLTLDQTAKQEALDAFEAYLYANAIDPETTYTCNTLEDFLILPDTDGCLTCDNWEDLDGNSNGGPNTCDDDPCGFSPTPTEQCEAFLNMLKADMSPGGQYFDNIPAGSLASASETWLETNVHADSPGNESWFNTEFGSADIDNWTDVRNNWISSWAAILVDEHPEYYHYEACVDLISSKEYDLSLMKIDEVADLSNMSSSPALCFSFPEQHDMVPSNSHDCDLYDNINDCFPLSYKPSSVDYGDPFFATISTSDRTTMHEILAAGTDDEGIWPTVWKVNGSSGTYTDIKWLMLRSYYLLEKSRFVETFKNSGSYDIPTTSQYYLVDVNEDHIADNTSSNPTLAQGFFIRDPELEIPSMTYSSCTTYVDYSTIYPYPEDWDDLFTEDYGMDGEENPCDGIQASISLTLNSGDPIICSSSCSTFVMYINSIQISTAYDFVTNSSNCSNTTNLASTLASLINTYSLTPEYTATSIGNVLKITAVASDDTPNGWLVSYKCNSADAGSTSLGSMEGGVDPVPCDEGQPDYSCFCNVIQTTYNYMLGVNGGAGNETAALADLTEYLSNVVLTYLTPPPLFTGWTTTEVNGWLDDCPESEPNEGQYGVDVAFTTLVNQLCNPSVYPCGENPLVNNLGSFYSNEAFAAWVNTKVDEYEQQYIQNCFDTTALTGTFDESLTFEGNNYEHHFTLYYYDRAGNLTKTVPPVGVKLLDQTAVDAVMDHRITPYSATTPFIQTYHKMPTEYRYNTYDLVIRQINPDTDPGLEILADGSSTLSSSVVGIGDIQMLDDQNGFVVGYDNSHPSNLYVYNTSDGGQTWTQVGSTVNSITMTDIDFYDSDHGYIVGKSGKAFYTSNGGVSWMALHDLGIPTPSNDIQAVLSVSTTKAYAVTSGGNVFELGTNSGNITSCATSTTNALYALDYNGSDKLYLTGYEKGIEFTINPTFALSTSANIGSFPTGVTGRAIKYYNPSEIVIIGDDGSASAIYKYTTSWGSNLFTGGDPLSGMVAGTGGQLYAHGMNTYVSSNDYGASWVAGNALDGVTGGDYDNVGFSPSGSVFTTSTSSNVIYNYSGSLFANRYFYDAFGRLKASQRSKQFFEQSSGYRNYSYTKYDLNGRMIEAGQLAATATPTLAQLTDVDFPVSWISTSATNEVSYTQYDVSIGVTGVPTQANLRNRVASVYYKDISTDADYRYATHYSYDEHGNVPWIVQDYTELEVLNQQFKLLEYDYDLISGNTNEFVYQRDAPDQIVHRYFYDADNRLIAYENSKDFEIWDRDAKYFYYYHGPVARIELGTKKVQGLDYSYTIHGWLKGMNAAVLNTENDMGKDGIYNHNYAGYDYNSTHRKLHHNIGRDAYAFTLGYYSNVTIGASTYNDYASIARSESGYVDFNTSSISVAPNTGTLAGSNLFNGNIGKVFYESLASEHSDGEASSTYLNPSAKLYAYDQLNRLRYSDFIIGQSHGTTNPYSSTTTSSGYKEEISYDANGNITALKRNGKPSDLNMDNLTYYYSTHRNRLERVNDGYTTTTSYTDDIESGQATKNYTYDADGNLSGDLQEGHDIYWNARGKVKQVDEATGSDIYFTYDALGQRIRKCVTGAAFNNFDYTYHVYDASGNIIATYDLTVDNAGTDYVLNYKLAELDLYASTRIGVLKNQYTGSLVAAEASYTYEDDGDFTATSSVVLTELTTDQANFNQRVVGDKNFELTNHLGNVMVIITDRKVGIDRIKFNGGGGGTHSFLAYSNEYVPGGTGFSPVSVAPGNPSDDIIDYYLPDVIAYSDYYSFGSLMPDRNGNSGNYRFGFNGMEGDPENKGVGNSYSTEYRQYDPRIGRWASRDPIIKPWESDYASYRNNPIYFIDPSGLDPTEEQVKTKKPLSKKERKAKLSRKPEDGDKTVFTSEDAPSHKWEYIYNKSDNEWNVTTYQDNEKVVSYIEEGHKDFAIYVAFPDQKAAIGGTDNSFLAKLGRKVVGNVQFPVGHAGIIIGNGETGETYYFDFGRFNKADMNNGFTRSNFTYADLCLIPAVFEGSVLKNSTDIVESLVTGPDSYFAKHNYGRTTYAVVTGLDFHKMYDFAINYGSKSFGFGEDQSFCAQFVNDCLNAGGENLPRISKEVNDNIDRIIGDYIRSGMNLIKLANEDYIPIPANTVKSLQKKYKSANSSNKTLRSK